MLPTHRPPTHPGEMLLKEFLEPLGVSQVEAATRMNIPFQRLNAIAKGRRGVSADGAVVRSPDALGRRDLADAPGEAQVVGPARSRPLRRALISRQSIRKARQSLPTPGDCWTV